MLDLLKSFGKDVGDVRMALSEFSQHVVQQRENGGLGKRENAAENASRSLVAARVKRANQNPGLVRPDGDGGACEGNQFSTNTGARKLVTRSWVRRSSVRDRRN